MKLMMEGKERKEVRERERERERPREGTQHALIHTQTHGHKTQKAGRNKRNLVVWVWFLFFSFLF